MVITLVKLVNITDKNVIFRKAIASGEIYLNKETLDRIKNNTIEKGDVLTISKIAAIMSVKNTPQIIPLCHTIQITSTDIYYEFKEKSLEVTCAVSAYSRTGVEMEALAGVSTALLTVWDMTKKYEKDKNGQYPYTKIQNIRVIEKIKGEKNEGKRP